MTTRLAKEAHELLPGFLLTALGITVPYMIWGKAAEGAGVAVLGLGCTLMGAAVFGHELQHRTLAVLLAQPLARTAVWREKMLVLSVAVLGSLVVLTSCLALGHRLEAKAPAELWAVLLLVPWCAGTGAVYGTLLTRNPIGGAVFALAFPVFLMVLTNQVAESRLNEHQIFGLIVGLQSVYGLVCLVLGYRRFQRLQLLEETATVLEVPAAFEQRLARLLGRMTSGFGRLVAKEVHLQQTPIGLACLLLVSMTIATGFHSGHHAEWQEWVLGLSLVVYLGLIPLLVGALATAEERRWDLADWHLTLPVSARRQWGAKMLVTFVTSLLLGLVLPGVAILLFDRLFGSNQHPLTLAPWQTLWLFALIEMTVTALAVYTGTFATSTLRAIVYAFAGLLLLGVCLWAAHFPAAALRAHLHLGWAADGEANIQKYVEQSMIVGLLVWLCLLQWFSWRNFRQRGWGWGRLVGQGSCLLLLAGYWYCWTYLKV